MFCHFSEYSKMQQKRKKYPLSNAYSTVYPSLTIMTTSQPPISHTKRDKTNNVKDDLVVKQVREFLYQNMVSIFYSKW